MVSKHLPSSPAYLKRLLWVSLLLLGVEVSTADDAGLRRRHGSAAEQLRFGSQSGNFKILQVADMHFADGATTPCEDVLPRQFSGCSDLNTTAFIRRMIRAEEPDLIVFTGDNIFGIDATDSARSMDEAFSPAVESGIPWAAVLGNHDQEGNLNRKQVMQHVAGMPGTLALLNPSGLQYAIDGYGNYNLKVAGAKGSKLAGKSVLNLYFLDSGDYSTAAPAIPGYGWIKASQQLWFQETSKKLQEAYANPPNPQKEPAPGIVFFHIPLPEYSRFGTSDITGVKQEPISSPVINSGFFATMVETGEVKAVIVGHDHVNDFCGELAGIHLCYGGGFGYHAYGKAGWSRRARVVSISLEKAQDGRWGAVKTIRTWKRLDDEHLSTIDSQVLWGK